MPKRTAKRKRGGKKAPRSDAPPRKGSVHAYKSWCVTRDSQVIRKSEKEYSEMTPAEQEEFCPKFVGSISSMPPSAASSAPPSRSVTPPPTPASVFAGPPPKQVPANPQWLPGYKPAQPTGPKIAHYGVQRHTTAGRRSRKRKTHRRRR